MSKLADIAKKVVGNTTIKIDEIVEQFGGVVTINRFEMSEFKGTKIPVFGFVEGAGLKFYGGCKKMRELADALIEEYDGDLRAINDDFRHTGLKVKFMPLTKTAGGNPFRPVIDLGEVNFDDDVQFDEETGEVAETKIADVEVSESNEEEAPF